MSFTKLEDLIRIQLAFGAGSARAYEVFKLYEANSILDADAYDKLEEIHPQYVKQIIDTCRAKGIEIVSILTDWYPQCLLELDAPPLVLYVKGHLPDFNYKPAVTIVGPRKVSEFGKRAAFSLGRRLAKAGLIVVSGAALGTDAAAHRGALSIGGTTVAVMGCGLNYDYLPQNRPLREEIKRFGCLISEYPPNEPTTRYSFPVRNRILACLSKATIVVEAPEKSGALSTAKHAYEQGRDVLVIPGNPSLNCYKGSNALLRDGAIPLIDSYDVLNLYLPQYSDLLDLKAAFNDVKTEKNGKIKKNINIPLSKEAEMLYNNIIKEKFTADDFCETSLSDDAILSALTELEMLSVIRSLPGGIYEII